MTLSGETITAGELRAALDDFGDDEPIWAERYGFALYLRYPIRDVDVSRAPLYEGGHVVALLTLGEETRDLGDLYRAAPDLREAAEALIAANEAANADECSGLNEGLHLEALEKAGEALKAAVRAARPQHKATRGGDGK